MLPHYPSIKIIYSINCISNLLLVVLDVKINRNIDMKIQYNHFKPHQNVCTRRNVYADFEFIRALVDYIYVPPHIIEVQNFSHQFHHWKIRLASCYPLLCIGRSWLTTIHCPCSHHWQQPSSSTAFTKNRNSKQSWIKENEKLPIVAEAIFFFFFFNICI